MIDRIPAPDIDLEEFDMLRRCLRGTWLDTDESPIEFLQQTLQSISCDIKGKYYTGDSLETFAGHPYDLGKPQEVKKYDDFTEKIPGWTPSQGQKTLEAIECL